VTGGELFDQIVSRSHFTEIDAAGIVEQILGAISYCHDQNICHRDLKPENLLVDDKDNDQIKIIDFGTAQIYDEDKLMNQLYGTAYYIAPEIVNGKTYNEKCDLWSIGVIMFILLVGSPPFDGRNDGDIIKSVKVGKYPTTAPEYKRLSADAKDLIKQLLTIDPKK